MTPEQAPRKPLRLWPGVVAVALQWLIRFGVPVVWPDALEFCVFAGVAGGVAVIVWWVFLSRASGIERWGAVVLMMVAMGATPRILHASIATGMMGMMFPVYAIPVLSLAFVIWAVATQRLSDGPRRATMVAAILLACGVWALLRTDGITGDAVSLFAWRWSPTAEERLLAHATDLKPPSPSVAPEEKAPAKPGDEAMVIPAPPVAASIKAEWPGFRGPRRDGSVPGVRINTDWAAAPPVELWRRPIGPGWSSFAVHDGLIYTQEQRGSDEVVACYNLTTGEPVWGHHDGARFWESNGGAGPRATPTLSNGRVYTFGATGIVNALDALTGKVLWSRNAASDTGVKIPEWGFASSPLVVGGVVIVAAAGELIAYDLGTGEQRWAGPNGRYGYSSPHPLTIDGVEQVLLLSGPGATSVSPIDGTRLWEYPLPPLLALLSRL